MKRVTEIKVSEHDSIVTIYDYDVKGNMAEENLLGPEFRWKNIYDGKNRLLVDTFYRNGNLLDYTIYTYTKNSQNEMRQYHPDGTIKLKVKFTYKYDEKGNQIEKNGYNAIGKLSKRTTFKYDNKGNQIETNMYMEDGKLFYKVNNFYDSIGKVYETITYQLDISKDKNVTYKYENIDKSGNWLRRTTFEDGKPIEIEERKIDYY